MFGNEFFIEVVLFCHLTHNFCFIEFLFGLPLFYYLQRFIYFYLSLNVLYFVVLRFQLHDLCLLITMNVIVLLVSHFEIHIHLAFTWVKIFNFLNVGQLMLACFYHFLVHCFISSILLFEVEEIEYFYYLQKLLTVIFWTNFELCLFIMFSFILVP